MRGSIRLSFIKIKKINYFRDVNEVLRLFEHSKHSIFWKVTVIIFVHKKSLRCLKGHLQ